jgi:hypothetical protein
MGRDFPAWPFLLERVGRPGAAGQGDESERGWSGGHCGGERYGRAALVAFPPLSGRRAEVCRPLV